MDNLDQLEIEHDILFSKLDSIRTKIKAIHAKRKEDDPNYCEHCKKSPCDRAGAFYDEDED